ncbi:MAG: carbamoyl phosphate synthase small subunit, partial [bacterium]
LSTNNHDPKILAAKLDSFKEGDLVAEATSKKASEWLPSHSKKKLAVLDLGSSRSLNGLLSQYFQIKLYPAKTKAEVLLAEAPDGIFISSGPGSPESIPDVIGEVKKLINKVPLSGAGLGHHVLGSALGAKVNKMKAGHHGANHPVRRVDNGQDEITVQNHSYTLDPESLKKCGAEIFETNVNDNTAESMRSVKNKIFSTEYFPLNLDEFKKFFRAVP